MLSQKLAELIPQSIRMLSRISSEGLGGALSFQQLRVLAYVKEGQGQTEIADSLKVSLAAVSKVVEALVQKDLVVRKVGTDRRTHNLTLTPKGRKILEQVGKFVDQKLNSGLGKLSQRERDDLLKGLLALDQLLQYMKEV